MTDEGVEIERLTLRLHGMTRRDGEAVARLVANGIVGEPAPGAAGDITAQVTAEGAPEDVARSILVASSGAR